MNFGDSVLSMNSEEEEKFHETDGVVVRKLFPLFTALETQWPRFVVLVGVVLEMLQMFGILLNPDFTWGKIIQVFSVGLESLILPFWDDQYVLSTGLTANGACMAVLFVVLCMLYFVLYIQFSGIDVRGTLLWSRFTKLLLYLLVGPFFLPSLHLLLALTVCTGAHGSSQANVLSEFPEEKCFDPKSPWMIVLFTGSALTLIMLLIPKIIVSLMIYDDCPVSDSVRSRSHSTCEGWVLVHNLLFCALYHYLIAIGQREAYAAMLSAGSFFIAALHVFYLPYYNEFVNRLRVIGYSCLSFASLVMTIALSVGPSSPIYAETNMDIAVLAPGCLVVSIIAYALTVLRVSSMHRRDVARARHGEIRPEKFVRRMFFPWYLPQLELHKIHANGYYLDARNNVRVRDPGPESGSTSMKNSLYTAGTSTILNSSVLHNLHREVEEMAKFEMTCYIDAVYCPSDVELATRFLISFTRVTNTSVPDHLLEYAISIYNKGLNRFIRDPWLQLQFAVFLCCYVNRTNHVSMALCEELQHRELGPIMAYRLFRCSSSISDQRIRRNQAARQQLQIAMKIHKETLLNMQLFWKRMISERVDVTILGEASMSIISGCNRGIRYYKAAIDQRTDGVILSRYAQFLEDIVLSPESAEYTREIAADMVVKTEQGIAMEDLKNDKIISSKKKLGSRYGRITRNLRYFLIAMTIIMFALLVAIIAVILSTYFKSTRVLDSLFAAASLRFYMFRCMWLAELALNSSETSSAWNLLEEDLTRMRELYQDLTYGKYKAVGATERDTVQGSYYSIIYGKDVYLLENGGVWRIGEVFIDAFETLVSYRSTAESRDSAHTLLRGNELMGAASAFNNSLVGYQDQGNTNFNDAIYVIIVLYVALVAFLFITFFMFRYYLARITAMGAMALSLFRLIPKNSLESMVTFLDNKIAHFEEPDATLQQMIRERKMAGYLGAEYTEMQYEASESSSLSVIPTLAPLAPGAAGGTGGAAGGGVGAGAGGAGGVGGHHSGRKFSDETSGAGNRFANLVLNASVADVGRIKFHVGQYEPPYQKGTFPPRQLTEEEVRQRQEEINDIEVEASLTKIRQLKENSKTAAGDQLDEGSTYFAPVSVDSAHDSFHKKLTLVLALLIVLLGTTIGILSIMTFTSLKNNRANKIPLLHEMNLFEQQTYNYFNALEAFVFLSAMNNGAAMDADSFLEVQSALATLQSEASNYAVATIAFTKKSSTEKSPQFTVNMQKFNYYSTMVVDQLLAAGKLGCSAALPPSGAPLDCSFFQFYNYNKELFYPNQTSEIVFERTEADLPTSWAVDSLKTDEERALLAVNVLASTYYTSLYNTTAVAWQGVRNDLTSGGSEGQLLSRVRLNKTMKACCFGLSIALVLVVVIACFQTWRYTRDSLVFSFCLLSGAVGGLVFGLNVYLFATPLPLDGPYSNCVSVLTFTSSIFTLQMQSLENMKQGSFAHVLLGVVNFATVTGQSLFSSWNSLFELLGSSYLEELTKSYDALQYSFFITTIVLRLGVSYYAYGSEFENLPIVKTCEWDIDKEVLGFRRKLMYEDTTQLLYSTKQADLAKPESEQKDLAYSLAFGPLRTGKFSEGVNYLNLAVKNFIKDQDAEINRRYNTQYPLMVASGICALVMAFINVIIIFFLVTQLMEMYHSRKGLGKRSRGMNVYDRGFARIIQWTSAFNIFFFLLVSLLCALVVVHYFNLLNTFRRINIVNLREIQLMVSDLSMIKGVSFPWYLAVAQFLAEAAVKSQDEYYRTTHLTFFKNVPPLLFGGVNNISYVRYNRDIALSTSVEPFQDQNPVIAFENYVDPSIRNWRQRVLEMVTMTATNRFNQNVFLKTPLYNLTTLSFASTGTVNNDLENDRQLWVIVQIVVFCLCFLMFCVTMWYMIFPVVRRLRQEEEGTQVVLQMIPPHIRTAIPAIYQYMKTGGLSQDTNAAEIDQISKDLSVVPIITINTAGKIRQFSRAAEESFLWTRSEAIGQNVSILMPDNIAAEHDRFLQNYLKTGNKYMIGNSRPIRAKRKDGTVFSAVLEVSEFHTGSELLFVGAVHVSQEVIELERSAMLSKGLTDASTIPIIVCDVDGVIQSFSKSAAEVFKCKEEEVVGQKVNVLMPRADADMHDSYIEHYVRTGNPNLLNKARLFRGKRMNGELFPIRLMVREFRLGGRILFVGYVEDLTVRLRQEMIAAAGEVMQEKCPVPLMVTDMEGRIVQCSGSLKQICGMGPSEVMGKDIRYLVKDESVMDLVEKVKNNPRGIQAHIDDFHTVECTVLRRLEEGVDSTFHGRITTRLFNWHTKGPHLMLFIEDLTNLKQLHLNSRVGSTMMELSAVPIVVVTSKGTIDQISAAGLQMFRCFAGEAYGKSIDILFDTDEEASASAFGSSRNRRRVNFAEDEGEMASVGSSEVSHVVRNPLARVVEEYNKSGTTSLCGRYLKGIGRTSDNTTFPVEVLVKDVEQGEDKLFVAYIRNTEEDHRLLEVTSWNDAFMALTPIPIVCSDLDGIIFACSDSTCKRFGWTREDLIGSNVAVLMPPRFATEHPKHMALFRESLESAYKEGERKSILNRSALFIGRAQDGEEFPVTVSLRDVHIEGADSFIVAALRPSQQDMELEALGKVGSTMSAISPCPYICINCWGIVTEFSRSAQEAFGYAEHEVVGQNITMLQTPDVAAHHDGYLRAYQKTGIHRVINQTVPVLARKKDGTLMNIELSVREVRHQNVVEFIGYIRDVTGKQTTKQMMALDELVELEAASPMLELDGRGNILEVRCLEHDFGYIKSDLLGKSVLTVIPHRFARSDEETWIQASMRELMNASKAMGGGSGADGFGSMSGNNNSTNGSDINWISRRLHARHKNGEEIWCDVVLGEITQQNDPIGGTLGAGVTRVRKTKGRTKEDFRVVVYIRNLQKEVLLELTHNINNTASELFPCPLLTLNTDGVITLFNRAAEEVFAYTSREAVGKSLKAFLTPSEGPRFDSAVDQLRAPSSDAFNETTLEDIQIRRKGSSGPATMVLSLQRLTDVNNRPYLLGTFRDPLSDQAAANEETLSNVLMSFSPVPIVVTDHRGMVEQFSSGAEEYLGFTQLDVEGKDVGIIRSRIASLTAGRRNHGSEDFLRASMTYTEGMQLPISIREKIIIRTKEGKEVTAHIQIHSIMPFKKKVPRFIAYMQDATNEINQQNLLERYNRLLTHSISGVLVIGAHGVVVESNPAAQNVLGYTKEDLKNCPVSRLLVGDNRQSSKLLRAISHVLETTNANNNTAISAVQVRDAEIACRGGTRISVDAVVATVLPSHGGETIRVAVNFIDVASEKNTKVCEQREEFLEEVSGVITIELDPNGNFIRASDTFLNLLEYSSDDVIGTSWRSVVPKGDQQLGHSIATAISVSTQGMEVFVEYVNLTFVAKSGVSLKMDGEMRSVVRADGSVCSIVGCLRLVQLRDTQLSQLAMTAMDVTDAALVLCTVDGAILATNTTTHRIFEIPSDTSIIGQRIGMFFPPEAVKESVERFQRLIIDGQTEIVRGLTYSQSTGEEQGSQGHFALEIKVVPVKDEDAWSGKNSSPNGSSLPSKIGAKSRRGSVSSLPTVTDSRRDRQSSLLLVRMRRVNEKHQLLLMRSAMEAALSLNTYASLTLDDNGIITTWSTMAHKLFQLPGPIGRNVLEVLFEQSSAAQLRQMLHQFRKQRILGEMERAVMSAYVYKAGATGAAAARASSASLPLGSPVMPSGAAGASITEKAPLVPVGVIQVEAIFKENKNEKGALVNGDLLCYIRRLGAPSR